MSDRLGEGALPRGHLRDVRGSSPPRYASTMSDASGRGLTYCSPQPRHRTRRSTSSSSPDARNRTHEVAGRAVEVLRFVYRFGVVGAARVAADGFVSCSLDPGSDGRLSQNPKMLPPSEKCEARHYSPRQHERGIDPRGPDGRQQRGGERDRHEDADRRRQHRRVRCPQLRQRGGNQPHDSCGQHQPHDDAEDRLSAPSRNTSANISDRDAPSAIRSASSLHRCATR